MVSPSLIPFVFIEVAKIFVLIIVGLLCTTAFLVLLNNLWGRLNGAS